MSDDVFEEPNMLDGDIAKLVRSDDDRRALDEAKRLNVEFGALSGGRVSVWRDNCEGGIDTADGDTIGEAVGRLLSMR